MTPDNNTSLEQAAILDEEIARLPESLRLPADHIGWKVADQPHLTFIFRRNNVPPAERRDGRPP